MGCWAVARQSRPGTTASPPLDVGEAGGKTMIKLKVVFICRCYHEISISNMYLSVFCHLNSCISINKSR